MIFKIGEVSTIGEGPTAISLVLDKVKLAEPQFKERLRAAVKSVCDNDEEQTELFQKITDEVLRRGLTINTTHFSITGKGEFEWEERAYQPQNQSTT